MRRGLLAGLITLVFAAPASAVTIQTSDTSEPWQAWANAAQVPTWQGTLPLTPSCDGPDVGCTAAYPQIDPTSGAILPGPPASVSIGIAPGNSTDLEHAAFLHELGHVFDDEYLTDADRNAFMSIAGLPSDSRWWYTQTTVVNGVTISFPPGEWFAEGYRFCATYGINQPASANTYSDYGYPGLQASFAARQRQVCQLIDQIGSDNGIPVPAQQTYTPTRLTGRVIHARVTTKRSSRLARTAAGSRLSRFRTKP